MPEPELSERFWTGKLPLRSFEKTICLEAGSKVKPERRVESRLDAPGFAVVAMRRVTASFRVARSDPS